MSIKTVVILWGHVSGKGANAQHALRHLRFASVRYAVMRQVGRRRSAMVAMSKVCDFLSMFYSDVRFGGTAVELPKPLQSTGRNLHEE